MSTLHLVFSTAGLAAAEARLAPDDVILLLGDGTYAARRGGNSLYALDEDMTMRGIQPADTVTVIDMAGMVDLTTRHKPLVSWRE